MINKFIIISSIFITFSAMASSPVCEVKNDEYDISLSYNSKLETISTIITKKDKSEIIYLNGGYTIGFTIKDYKPRPQTWDMTSINDRYGYMMSGNADYFSKESTDISDSSRIILPIPIENFSKGKTLKADMHVDLLITESREVQEKINDSHAKLRSYKESDKLDLVPFSNQIITPKVKIILDPEIKTCIDYSGKPFEYNFGNRYLYQFNVWWPKFKGKTKQTWEAIIE